LRGLGHKKTGEKKGRLRTGGEWERGTWKSNQGAKKTGSEGETKRRNGRQGRSKGLKEKEVLGFGLGPKKLSKVGGNKRKKKDHELNDGVEGKAKCGAGGLQEWGRQAPKNIDSPRLSATSTRELARFGERRGWWGGYYSWVDPLPSRLRESFRGVGIRVKGNDKLSRST